MRAKFVNEKFTEDSDPIYDLGIGTRHLISKWMNERDEEDTDDNALAECAEQGKTEALRYASRKGHLKIVKMLLDAGANVRANSNDALQMASREGHVEIVKLLLAAGADPRADHDWSLHLAEMGRHDSIIKILQDHMKKNPVNEKFTEDSDPIADMGIGVKHNIKYILDKIPQKIDEICKKQGIYIIQSEDGYSLNAVMRGNNKQKIINSYNNKIHRGKIKLDFNYPGKIINTVLFNPYDNYIKIKVYDNAYADKNLKIINKEIFIKDVFKQLNVLDYFEEPIIEHPNIFFKIKPQYIRHFKETLLNEKFIEHSDPISDMGIGLFSKRTFNNVSELVKFLTKHIKEITDYKGDLKNVLVKNERYDYYHLRPEHKSKVIKYCEKYVSDYWVGDPPKYADDDVQMNSKYNAYITILESYMNEGLYEKFTEDSDPIVDMGIGLLHRKPESFKTKKQYVEWLYAVIPLILKIDEIPPDILGEDSDYYDAGIISWPYYYIIDEFLEEKNLNTFLGVDWEDLLHAHLLKKGFMEIGKYTKRTNISPYLKESLNEKFTEDSDPIVDMGIGMMRQIKEFIKNQSELGVLSEDEYIATCAEYGETKFVKYLLQNKKYTDMSLDDALDWAGEYGHLDIVKMLIDAGANIDSGEGYPLRNAVYNGHKDVAQYLLSKGADQSYWNYTPLESAFDNKDFDIADILIDNLTKRGERVIISLLDIYVTGPSDRNRYGIHKTPLDINSSVRKDVIKYLNKSRNIFEKFTEDSDPIQDMGIGMMCQIKDFMQRTHGHKFEMIFDETEYIVQCAKYEQIDFVRYLIDKKLYTNSSILDSILVSVKSHTANISFEILKLLLEVVDKTSNLYTYSISKALMAATMWENIPAVKLLLKHGADPTRDWGGNKLADMTRNENLINLLKRAEIRYKYGKTKKS